MKITVTRSSSQSVGAAVFDIDHPHLSELVLNAFGSGHTAQSTANAMEALHRLREGQTVQRVGWKFEPVEEAEVDGGQQTV